MQGQAIDVEKIMEEIRQDIKNNGFTEDMLSFHECKVAGENIGEDSNELTRSISNLSATANVNAFPVFTDNIVKVFIKKVIRKISKCVFVPIVLQQITYNSENVSVLEQMNAYITLLEGRMRSMEERVCELEKQADESGK